VARSLGSDPARGLEPDEAARRLAAEGPNRLRGTPVPAPWRRLLAQFRDPLVGLLVAAMAIALLAWRWEGGHGWPVDALVIAAVLLGNAALGFAQESRARDAVAALARMTAATSTVLRGGRPSRVPDEQLVRGDILLLAEGDAVGADALLLEAASLRVDESALTGESVPVEKAAAAVPTADERADRVSKGTMVVAGNARALVTATGMATEIGAIAGLIDTAVEEPTPLQREVAAIGRMLTIAVGAIAVIVVASVMWVSGPVAPAGAFDALLLGVSLAVAAVPEGLPAVLSVVLALGVQRMARRNAVVRSLSSVETLGCASVICSDKTGTLTRSEMTIQRVVTASGSSRVSGVGYRPEGVFEHAGRPLAEGAVRDEHAAALSFGSLAGNASLRRAEDGRWEIHGDPTEAAFLVAERKLGVHDERRRRFRRVAEIPFSAERKRMSSIEADLNDGGRRVIVTKGAPDELLGRCTRVRVGDTVLPMDDARRRGVLADVDGLAGEALRTLAVAYRPLAADEPIDDAEALERDLVFVGVVGIIDPPRPEAAVAVKEASAAGIRVLMITGDHPRTAARIAADLGIAPVGAAVLTGREIDAMSPIELAAAVQETSVYARVKPAHKLQIVDLLQRQGHVVAMTGDGVNDAPALKAADIGVAMGIAGTEVSKQAARMILADDNFATIVAAVREGRRIHDNIRRFLRYLLSSNMGEVLTVFLGVTGGAVLGLHAGADGAVVLPLLATQILWINLVTDSGPALAMGMERGTDDAMSRPPRGRTARAIDGRMWTDVLTSGLVMATATLLTLDAHLPGGLIEGSGSLAEARTAAFTVLVLAQLFNCLDARSETASALRRPFTNRWLWGALALSLALQVAVVHTPVLNHAFATVPLTATQWLACAAAASSVLGFGELRKAARRWHDRRGTPEALKPPRA
jgi:magnesium-transporting ATPase (P-type)